MSQRLCTGSSLCSDSFSSFRTTFSIALLIAILAGGIGCGGSFSSSGVPPVFTSSAPSYANEGEAYSYQLGTNPSEGVTYSLVTSPTGATLSGATIGWTPTHAQSRKLNDFKVTAKSHDGATATQSFTVTPLGSIQVEQIDSFWTENGRVDYPNDLSFSGSVRVLVPNGSGGVTTFLGSGSANGAFTIPNVPAGYYWLQILPFHLFWTDTSDFDAGQDYIGRPQNDVNFDVTANLNVTNLTIGGYDDELFGVSPNAASHIFFRNPLLNSDVLAEQRTMNVRHAIDPSQGDTTYLLQQSATLLGDTSTLRVLKTLGPLSLSITPSMAIDITGAFTAPNPGVFHPFVNPTAFMQSISATSPNANAFGFRTVVSYTPRPESGGPLLARGPRAPLGTVVLATTTSPAADTFSATDLSYVNPFPASWKAVYAASQLSSVIIGSNGMTSFGLIGDTGYMSTTPPAADAPFQAQLLNPRNPKINGNDFFTTATINSTPNISWDAPAGTLAPGYWLILTKVDLSGPVLFTPAAIIGTQKTSVTVPPGILEPGKSYSLGIYARYDTATNLETAPYRSSLERAFSSVLSGMLTVSGGSTTKQSAQAPVISSPCARTYFVGFEGARAVTPSGCEPKLK